MKPSVEQVEKLLASRRDEGPGDGYWEEFLCEFHHRQRQQVVRKSPIINFFLRVRSGFSELGPSKWIYGAGLAYAAVTVGFFLAPPHVESGRPEIAPVHREIPATVPNQLQLEQLEQLDLDPATKGTSGEQVF